MRNKVTRIGVRKASITGGNTLKAAVYAIGKNLSDLSLYLGVDRPIVSHWVRDLYEPKDDQKRSIMKFLGKVNIKINEPKDIWGE